MVENLPSKHRALDFIPSTREREVDFNIKSYEVTTCKHDKLCHSEKLLSTLVLLKPNTQRTLRKADFLIMDNADLWLMPHIGKHALLRYRLLTKQYEVLSNFTV